THSFKDYDEILNFYGVWDYECPNPECRAGMHPLHRHGRYKRGLILWDGKNNRPQEEQMEILRLKCSSCGTTHAVLTMDMIPFCVYSIQALLALLAMCMEAEGSVLRTEERTGVSYQMRYRFLLIFHGYRERLSLFVRLETLWKGSAQPLDRQILPLLQAKPRHGPAPGSLPVSTPLCSCIGTVPSPTPWFTGLSWHEPATPT
ncbi:MAG: DUF6431 domain-containing protein, partial [Butyrivibrio sp.]|nr:DUF6431 domain-containing protein [Acetatifactor muris]MCM1561364.1 DUF6431 domain-containing protein [Butyrivibrio sp.]